MLTVARIVLARLGLPPGALVPLALLVAAQPGPGAAAVPLVEARLATARHAFEKLRRDELAGTSLLKRFERTFLECGL